MTIASSPASPSSAAQFSSLQSEVRRALTAYAEEPGEVNGWQELIKIRRALAEAIVALPTAAKGGPVVEMVFGLLHEFEDSGAADQPAAPEDLALLETYRKRNWPGLLASMALVPAWQWPAAPALDAVQPWLWAEYTRWLFYAPKGFTAVGQAEAYAAHYLRRLEELAFWGTRNRGSAAVKGALDCYLQTSGGGAFLQLSDDSLRQHAEQRGKVLKAAWGVAVREDMPALSRTGRRLRVGFITSVFGANTNTFRLLPLFEQLDPERFEAVLLSFQSDGDTIEDHCRTHAQEFHVLPPDTASQLDAIRAKNLDVLVYGADVTNAWDDITRLALHRLAPLQVATNASPVSSGLPEIDLYLSGAGTEIAGAAAQFSERLGLLPGPAHTFSFEHDRQEPAMEWTRATLGLPTDAVVFVATADHSRITAEVRECWARLLAVVPGSRLLVHPFHDDTTSSRESQRFCARFDRVLVAHGLTEDRLIVVTESFASRSDVKAFLRVADVFLDTFPMGSAAGLVDPLEIGLPVVVQERESSRSRRGAGLLRTLGTPALIAANVVEYEAIALKLATDMAGRQACGRLIRERMERTPAFLNVLAASDAFGDLIEIAFDELVEIGLDAFRKKPAPVSTVDTKVPDGFAMTLVEEARMALGSAPGDTTLRHNLGRALLEIGRSARAVTYLLAALQGGESNAALWRDLALALRADGKRNQAIEALETCLRLDPAQGDSWLMLIDLAESSGAVDFAREALEAFRANVPDHEQIPMIAARLGC